MRDKAISVLLVAMLLVGVLGMSYALWRVRAVFYYDSDPVVKTINETVKPECLVD